MLPENRQALMRYRLSMAKERLDSSKLLPEHASYKDSIGRSYYAMFTAVRAILALDGVDFKKHAGVISYFQREYVKTKIFDVEVFEISESGFSDPKQYGLRRFLCRVRGGSGRAV